MFLTCVTVASVLSTPSLARVLGQHTSPIVIPELQDPEPEIEPETVAARSDGYGAPARSAGYGFPPYWYGAPTRSDGYGAPARSAGVSSKSTLFIRPQVPHPHFHGTANHRTAE